MDTLTDEINNNQMKHSVGEQKDSKGSFWWDGQELAFILRINLDSQTHWRRHEDIIQLN